MHIYCSMVGNFQETTVSSVHFIGASLCFGLGTIYIWIQVWLTLFKQECFASFHCSTHWYSNKWFLHFTKKHIPAVLCCLHYWPSGVPDLVHLAPLLPPEYQGDEGDAGRPGHPIIVHSSSGSPGGSPGLRCSWRVRESKYRVFHKGCRKNTYVFLL